MLKKSSPLLLLLCCLQFTALGQNPNENNIYYRALAKYSEWVEKFEPETKTMYFEEIKGITSFFPKEIRGIKIQIITPQNTVQIYDEHDGELIHRKMTPAQFADGKIDIGVIPYKGQYSAEQGGLRLGLSKWYSVIFEYNEFNKKFEYRKIENNG